MLNKIKNLKMTTKLAVGYAILVLITVLNLYTGYSTAATIIYEEDPEHYLSSYATFTSIEFVVMMIVTAGISIYFTRTLRKNLEKITKAAEEISLGKVDIQLAKDCEDEFGVLTDAFQRVIDSTREQAEVAQKVAEGDMTVEIQPRSGEDVMGHALQKMVWQNRSSLGNIKEAAYQVTTSSAQVASASESLAQGSTEQASAIEQVTASITDVAEKTRENASQANAAAELMATAIENVRKGNAEMQEMVVAMEEINKASEGISKIIKVIDDIAFQTNILALNAAVEAARAGEAGKGFAVVAEEVRNLAAKSSAAAAETAEMIEGSIQKVAAGTKIASETAVALEEITKVVNESENLVTEIAASSNYQATAIAQIDQAIEQVSQVVQTNSATSEECAAASQELAEQAGIVREMIATYKLDDDVTVSGGKTSSYGNFSRNERNEQIISLKGNFGKY